MIDHRLTVQRTYTCVTFNKFNTIGQNLYVIFGGVEGHVPQCPIAGDASAIGVTSYGTLGHMPLNFQKIHIIGSKVSRIQYTDLL